MKQHVKVGYAIALATLSLAACTKSDIDDSNANNNYQPNGSVTYDCQNLQLDYGDTCMTGSGMWGIVDQNCSCDVGGDSTQTTWDCPNLEQNIGDTCMTSSGLWGMVDQNCMCDAEEETVDCPGLGNIGDPCQGGWGTISADCDCVENVNIWDCPDVQLNIGDTCVTNFYIGTINAACECVE